MTHQKSQEGFILMALIQNLYPFEGPCRSRYSPVTVTSVMVFVGPGKVHVSFGPDYYEYCRCGIFGEVCPIPLFGAC